MSLKEKNSEMLKNHRLTHLMNLSMKTLPLLKPTSHALSLKTTRDSPILKHS